MHQTTGAADLYLNLIKLILTRSIVPERYRALSDGEGPTKRAYKSLLAVVGRGLARKNLEIVRRYQVDWEKREQGSDWPPDAETMVGLKRLDNVQACIADVLQDGIPGDVIEAGTWRGGCSIFMRAALEAFGDTTRIVWVADSFEGLPKPDAQKYPRDAGDVHWTNHDYLAVPLETVQGNFKRYGFLDDRVRFLKGWFKDTLPTAPLTNLALVRLDGDMYESTIQALDALYPKLSPGGYLIIDDYALPGCRAAVNDYRATHGIKEEVLMIDWTGAYWRRSSG
jgi:O-methyltransferase